MRIIRNRTKLACAVLLLALSEPSAATTPTNPSAGPVVTDARNPQSLGSADVRPGLQIDSELRPATEVVKQARPRVLPDETARVERAFEAYKDHTNAMLALIAVLLGLVGVLFPIVTYLTSVLPGNRIIDEARRTLASLDERFVELAAAHQHRLIDEAIKRLASESEHVRQSAATYLALSVHHAFSDRQIFDICAAADQAPTLIRSQLFSVLAGRDSDYITNLFAGALHGPEAAHVLPYVIKHCGAPGAARLGTKLREWMLSDEGRKQVSGVFMNCAMSSQAMLRELIGDGEFISKLGTPEKVAALTLLRNVASAYKIQFLEESELVRQLRGTVKCFVKSGDGQREVNDPTEADTLLVYDNGQLKGSHRKDSAEFRSALESGAAPPVA